MYRALHVFIKGSEVNYEPEFSVLLRHKARRSAKLRLFIGLHPPYYPLRLQLIYHSPSLGFDFQRDQSGFEAIKGRIKGPIRGIFDRDTLRRGSQITVGGKRLREQIPEFENEITL